MGGVFRCNCALCGGRPSPFLIVLGRAAAPYRAGQGSGFNPALPLTHVDNGGNSAWAQSQHYVVLVSLDGFRWDYAKRDNAVHLLALAKQGVWAPEGMMPSYPPLTFPTTSHRHWPYPEHHGIVANSFLDPDARLVTPVRSAGRYGWLLVQRRSLWSLAESRGMRRACLLWPGSEAKIAGFRPRYYARYDAKTERTPETQQARIDDLRLCSICPRQIARISSPSTFPNPITRAMNLDRTRPKRELRN